MTLACSSSRDSGEASGDAAWAFMGARFRSSLEVSTPQRSLSIIAGFLPHSGVAGRPDYQTLTIMTQAPLVSGESNRK
jgi:hypothetical protein